MSNKPTIEVKVPGSFLSLLCLLFIALKLGDVIDWSWWWVLAPLWAMPAIVIAFLVLFMVVGMFSGAVRHWNGR